MASKMNKKAGQLQTSHTKSNWRARVETKDASNLQSTYSTLNAPTAGRKRNGLRKRGASQTAVLEQSSQRSVFSSEARRHLPSSYHRNVQSNKVGLRQATKKTASKNERQSSAAHKRKKKQQSTMAAAQPRLLPASIENGGGIIEFLATKQLTDLRPQLDQGSMVWEAPEGRRPSAVSKPARQSKNAYTVQSRSGSKPRSLAKRSKSKKLSKHTVKVARRLAELFAVILSQEKKVEHRRQVLAEIKDFEPFSKYHHIIKHDPVARRQCILTSVCLKKFLEANHLSAPAAEQLSLESDRQRLLLQQFQAASANEITYSEFLRAILPNNKKQLREKILRKQRFFKKPKKVHLVVDSKINFCISQVFDQAIKMHIAVTQATQQVQVLRPNLGEAFRLLHDPKNGRVSRMSILVFLKRFLPDLPLKQEDGDVLLRYLGLEKQMEMSYANFVGLLYPEGEDNVGFVDTLDVSKALRKSSRKQSTKRMGNKVR